MNRLFYATPSEVSVYQGYANEWSWGLSPYRDYWFEYPPGILLLGRMPQLISHNPNHYFAIWLCMIAISLLITYLALGRKALWILSAAFAAGILTTHRFDIFVTVIVALALQARKDKSLVASSALLTFGVFTKIYPIIPLLLLFVFSPMKDYKKILAGSLVVAIPMLYIWYPGVTRFIEFHGKKPVQIESIVVPQNPGPVSYERFSWVHHETQPDKIKQAMIAIVGIATILVAKKYSDYETASYAGVLAFILAGNIFSPQYMLWLASFLPFIAAPIALSTLGLTWLTSIYFGYYDAIILGLKPERTLLDIRNWLLIRLQSIIFFAYLFNYLKTKRGCYARKNA